MKKLLIFLALLISLQGFGQTVLTSGTTVLRSGTTVLTQNYETESDAIFAAMGTTPSDARKLLIDNLVKGLKDDGVWTLLDFFYVLAAHAENSSLLNLINPGTFDATNVSSTAYEVDRGYTGAAGDYLNSNYNPNTDRVNYVLDDCSMGVYVRTDLNAGVDIGGLGGSTSYIYPRIGGNSGVRMNSGGDGTVANANSQGFYIVNRVLSTHQDLYKNKVRTINHARNSTTIPDIDFYILAYNNSGTATLLSSKQVAAAFAGGGMTQTQVTAFTDRLETYMDAIGAGVISEMMWLILLLIPNIRRKEEEFKIAA